MAQEEIDSGLTQRWKTDADQRMAELPFLCRSVTERSPLAMVAVEGVTYLVRWANLAFCQLAGKTREELLGKAFAEAMPEGERTECTAVLERVYRIGKSESIGDPEDTPVFFQASYWAYTMWAVVAPDGHTAGVMIYVTDTTEGMLARQDSERMNQEILEINEALVIAGVRENELAEEAVVSQQELFQAQKMEGIGRLAGGIAHDFNNLLTVILGFTELAEEVLQADDAVQTYLRNIQEAAERAAVLTGQLLAFARKQIIEPKIVHLNTLIRDIDQMLRRLLGEQMELTLWLQPDAGQARIDPGQFGQVLINLIVNARDAMPGGGKITIETANILLYANRADQQQQRGVGDYVLVSVSDTGTGIDEETRAHLFEPFFTTKEQGKGTGLGLATCYGIVTQAGGHIEVDSTPGQGTTFYIYLPRETEGASPVQQSEAAPALPQETGVILLVEDEPLVREVEAQILRRQGYVVFGAANGKEALEWIAAYRGEIDLLVTDVVMPQMGGRELADRLHATHPNTKVLYTSGHTTDGIVRQGMLDPGLAFLQKPFQSAVFVQKVRDVMVSDPPSPESAG